MFWREYWNSCSYSLFSTRIPAMPLAYLVLNKICTIESNCQQLLLLGILMFYVVAIGYDKNIVPNGIVLCVIQPPYMSWIPIFRSVIWLNWRKQTNYYGKLCVLNFAAIQHKEKSWYDYLIKNLTGARKAAEHLFNKVCND